MNAPREGRWTAKPLKRRLRLFDVAWALALPMYLFAFLDQALDASWSGIVRPIAIVLTLFFLATLVLLPLRELAMRRRSRRDRSLSDGDTGVREWAAAIVVEARGRTLGADRGVVWFHRGLMGFTGERTSFLLGYHDFDWPGRNAISWFDVPFAPLKLDAPQRASVLSVRPMWGHGRGYRRELRRFLREKARSDEARQWPPLRTWKDQEPLPLEAIKG